METRFTPGPKIMRSDGSHNGKWQRRFCPFDAIQISNQLYYFDKITLDSILKSMLDRQPGIENARIYKNRTAPANGVTGGGGVRISNLSQSLAASLCLHLTLRRFDDLMEARCVGFDNVHFKHLMETQNFEMMLCWCCSMKRCNFVSFNSFNP